MLVGLAMGGLELASIAHGQEPAPPAFEKAAGNTQETEAPDVFDPDIDAPKQVQVQVEFVEMSHEALTKLLFLAKPASADATKLREQVQEMVAKNEAKVLETLLSTSKSGQKATTEAIHEFIYPTEYEPPQLPGSFGKADDAVPPSPAPPNKPSPLFNGVPTAFDTRNLGSTLEIETTIGVDNKLIDLHFVPELVWHTGTTTWHEGKDAVGNPFKFAQPDIYVLRTKTSITCISGQYTLTGVVSPKNDKGEADMTRKVMIFVKCDVLVVK